MFTNLRELVLSMPDEKSCRDYLAKQRWVDGKAVCPYCGFGKCYNIENGKRYKCGSSECYKKFSVTVGTIFEASNIPLAKWFAGIYLMIAHKKGISSYQLGKDLGIAQKNAWFMLHRMREMMRPKENIKLDNIVEIDEVYMGGKVSNMSKSKRTMLREQGLTMQTKIMVMGMVERSGSLKLIAMGKPSEIKHKMQDVVRTNVDTDAVLITDSMGVYTGLNKDYAAHEVVNHSESEYVRDSVFHTNTIEGAFSLFKRSIYGIYHFCTPKHLSRYADETMFRYNFRKMKDAERFTFSLGQVEGRLTYKKLVGIKQVKNEIGELILPIPAKLNSPYYGRPVAQIKDGEIVAQFGTIKEAGEKTGITWQSISRVLNGRRRSTGGYKWKYL